MQRPILPQRMRTETTPLPSLRALAAQFAHIRRRSLALAAPLSEEDCGAQSMADASPVKWHLAHTTWFFETFILETYESGFRPFDPAFRILFNSYYNGVGARHPRPERGLLTRPGLPTIMAYRAAVDERIGALLEAPSDHGADPTHAGLARLLQLGLQHEQQHQELLLTDVKHLLSFNPAMGAYAASALPASPQAPAGHGALGWQRLGGGVHEIGHGGDGFCFDNEMPRHRQFIEPFEFARRLVSNREFAAFIEAGGYRDPALWLAEGWDLVCRQQWSHPLYWRRDPERDGKWLEFTLHGLGPLDPERPVTHVSLFEADAYAQWLASGHAAGADHGATRLPTEAEWECAADAANAAKITELAQYGHLHPHAAADGDQISQLFADCWQWTSSSYAPYPGFSAAAGAIGEYNGKFMINQYVLRGSSCATPPGHSRNSYRNFFPAGARWQFSGIRLARSV